jgi:signal transduction histidine kinase
MAVPIGWQIADGYDRWPAWLIGMTFAGACGVLFRKQQETLHRLQVAQQELADKAVTDERRRIAREVHDLVAHSLAVTMLHLTGARLALADGETAEAEAALAEAEKLGRSSMTGIRQAVGLLTESTDGVSWRPEPDVGDVPALVEDYRRAGVDVRFSCTGAPSTLEPATGLAAFRLVQESLANAVRHAPGRPVSIVLHWEPGGLALAVANDVEATLIPSAPGHGLVGMRERVEQVGGRFSAGRDGSSWCVDATLPLAVDAETASR